MVSLSLGRGSRKGTSALSLSSMTTWALSLLLSYSVDSVFAKSAADYYVRSLPGAPDGPLLKMHAG